MNYVIPGKSFGEPKNVVLKVISRCFTVSCASGIQALLLGDTVNSVKIGTCVTHVQVYPGAQGCAELHQCVRE